MGRNTAPLPMVVSRQTLRIESVAQSFRVRVQVEDFLAYKISLHAANKVSANGAVLDNDSVIGTAFVTICGISKERGLTNA